MGGVNGVTLEKMNLTMASGGGAVLDRIVLAYGFSSKIELAQHFDIAGSSLSNRYRRDTFPSDFVVQCMAETGVSLKWLATGEGPMHESMVAAGKTITIDKFKLANGELISEGTLMLDVAFAPHTLKRPQAILSEGSIHLIESDTADLSDGKWLVDIEGKASIRDLALIPVKRIHVTGGQVPFECSADDIKILGKVIGIYSEVK